MIFEEPQAFLTETRAMQALAGLDLGTKTIGVAVSDRLWNVATADRVIKRKKFTEDAAQIADLVNQLEITGLVLGLPRNMDGSEGPRAQSTRAFARNLVRFMGENAVPILLWDERLSTVEAERAMIEADMSRQKRSEKIDAVAASLILQGALDRFRVLQHG